MTGFIVGVVIGLICGGALVWIYKDRAIASIKESL